MIDGAIVTRFKSSLRGELILPGDESYDRERKVFNGMIDRHPAMIAKCADVADVITAVNFGRDNNILLSIRGGGHNAGGLGVCEGGLVIDLSKIKYTHVDPVNKTVRVGGGCTWGDVDHATNAFGYAVPSGVISTTGVGGLCLGGGVGHLSRKYGLSIDNLLEADVVLANGKLVRASATENKDLFWALRGGGGNFGVVTSFLFKLNKLKNVYAGPTLWHMDKAAEMMRWYDNFIRKAPEDLNGFFMFMTVPPGEPFPENLHYKKMAGVVWCYTGPESKAEKVFEPIRKTNPDFQMTGTMPFPMLQSMFDPLLTFGLNMYWRADFMKDLSDEAIDINVKYGNTLPTLLSLAHFYPINGAASKPGKKDTAWSYRDATYAMVMVGVDPDPANNEIITKWTKEYYEELHPHTEKGAYVNFMMDDEGDDRIKATYRDNYAKLTQIKRRYDPKNLFRGNQNIKPTPKTKAA
jgi:hypothetical protein